LTIETRSVELNKQSDVAEAKEGPDQFVMLAISDTGCGMPPELKARIFEPFFTTKDVGKGTGLGLAVVHGIVTQSGGNIEVYSEVGIGTTFKIYLPAVQEQVSRPSHQEPEPVSHGSETILLVEDEDTVREFGSLVLQGLGYKVLAAPGSVAAIRLMESRQEKVDLLVTDVVMPEMGGRKLAEALRSQDPGLKVLFMSGYTDDAIIRHGVLDADVAFLQKPYRPDSLAKKVRDVLDQNPRQERTA
jgi:two-component system, cell cycle sensor histidine kinase and response regulator CckA